MKKNEQTALFNLLGIIFVVASTAVLIATGTWSIWTIALALCACLPMAKPLWQYATCWRQNTIRLLRKALPKAGFTIESTEWNDQHTTIHFLGKFRGDNFMITAAEDCAHVLVYDKPWYGFKASDPGICKLMEAVNEVNAEASNMSVIVCEPDDEGIRLIYTLSKTILPTTDTEQYLDYLMCEMLNRKPALMSAINKERPYMAQRRGAVGFNVQSTPNEEVPMSPAAQKSEHTTI